MICSSRKLLYPRFVRGVCRSLCFTNALSFQGIVFSSFPLVGTIDVGKARLMFWDLGGQEELQSLWDKVGDAFFFPFRNVFLSFTTEAV